MPLTNPLFYGKARREVHGDTAHGDCPFMGLFPQIPFSPGNSCDPMLSPVQIGTGTPAKITLLDLREEGLRIQENIFVSGERRSGPQAQARKTAREN